MSTIADEPCPPCDGGDHIDGEIGEAKCPAGYSPDEAAPNDLASEPTKSCECSVNHPDEL